MGGQFLQCTGGPGYDVSSDPTATPSPALSRHPPLSTQTFQVSFKVLSVAPTWLR